MKWFKVGNSLKYLPVVFMMKCLTFGTVVALVMASCTSQNTDSPDTEKDSTAAVQLSYDSLFYVPENWPISFGFGADASAEDIKILDIDVMPDGTGLPEGKGTVAQGAIIYKAKCVTCHGPTGTEGPFDRLVGREPKKGFPFGRDEKLRSHRTIGNYWPHATTIFDYIRRAMPQNEPGSLSDDEVFALTAFLLLQERV